MNIKSIVQSLSGTHGLILFCFFLSGFTGLAYEICWIRKSTLVFGASAFAISTVISVFFIGLSIGAFLSGPFAQKTKTPIKQYGFLEIGIGFSALLSPYLFTWIDLIYGLVYPGIANNFFLLTLIRVLLITVIILPPTICMGATLPLLARYFITNANAISFSSGFLYGINTLGAASGAWVCGLWLIPMLGLVKTVWLSSAINFIIGYIALSVRQTTIDTPADPGLRDAASLSSGTQPIHSVPDGKPLYNRTFLYGLFLLSGFAGLATEVLWTRYLSLIVHNTIYTYTISLGITLTGIVFGSIISAVISDRFRMLGAFFGLLQIASALAVLSVCLAPAHYWSRLTDTQSLSQMVVIASIALTVPAVISGMLFPAAVKMAVSSLAFVSIGVGSLTAVNTAGGVLGSLSAGFFLIPFIGLQKSFYCTTGINLLIGVLSLFFLASRMNARIKWIISIISIGLWIGIPFQIKTKIPADFLSGRNELIYVAEGINSNCAVVRSNKGTSLEIDRLWQGDDRRNRQIMAAHVPMVFHKNPRDILVIGIGTGQTASRFLYYPVRRLDCVDIEPQLPELIRKFFPAGWMNDTRVSVIIDDGRNYIAHTANAYDIVSIEVGQTFRPNIASFYTVDFYQKILRCLKQDGLISQFVSLAALGPEEYKSVIKSFLEVFPKSILWYNGAELLLIGSPGIQPFISSQRLQGVLADSVIAHDLSMAYWGGPDLWLNHPDVFIAGFLSGAHTLAMLCGISPAYYDDTPVMEYTAARRQTNPPYLHILRSFLDSPRLITDMPLNDSTRAKIDAVREHNIEDIVAGELVQRYNATNNVQALFAAITYNPDNYPANLHLGIEYKKAGNYERALYFLVRAVTINPSNAQAHNDIGVILAGYRAFDKALYHYSRAIALDSSYALAYNNLGALYAAEKRFAEAIPAFQKAIALKQGYREAQENLDRCLDEQAGIEDDE